MKSSSVVLRDESSANGTRHLTARIDENGNLCIEGQDSGAGIGQFWGSGLREYEWSITIHTADVPRVTSALGGIKGDHVLSLLAARYAEDEQYDAKDFFEEQGIPVEFFSHVGN